MMPVQIIPILRDNYSYLITSEDSLIVVDPGEAAPICRILGSRKLTHILITHHHSDHIGGLMELKKTYSCKVYGPAAEAVKIPGLDEMLQDEDEISIGKTLIRIISTPGHTVGHVCYWLPQSKALFSGDTLFSIGCGRLLEGTANQLFDSLQKLKCLPDETKLYCGHEYTQTNVEFALSVDSGSKALQEKLGMVKKLRANDLPTLPTTFIEEKALNPFLKCENAETFAALRRLKDRF